MTDGITEAALIGQVWACSVCGCAHYAKTNPPDLNGELYCLDCQRYSRFAALPIDELCTCYHCRVRDEQDGRLTETFEAIRKMPAATQDIVINLVRVLK